MNLHVRVESSATGRVVCYVRAELSATGRAVHGPSCPPAELSGNQHFYRTDSKKIESRVWESKPNRTVKILNRSSPTDKLAYLYILEQACVPGIICVVDSIFEHVLSSTDYNNECECELCVIHKFVSLHIVHFHYKYADSYIYICI